MGQHWLLQIKHVQGAAQASVEQMHPWTAQAAVEQTCREIAQAAVEQTLTGAAD
jgi:hypothetical protein